MAATRSKKATQTGRITLPAGAPALLKGLNERLNKEEAILSRIKAAHEKGDKTKVFQLVGEFFAL